MHHNLRILAYPWYLNSRFIIIPQIAFTEHFIVETVTIYHFWNYFRCFELLDYEFIGENDTGIVEFQIFIYYFI